MSENCLQGSIKVGYLIRKITQRLAVGAPWAKVEESFLLKWEPIYDQKEVRLRVFSCEQQ